MVDALGTDTPAQGYDGIIDLTRRLNSKFRTTAETQETTRRILNALFPSWLPPLFRVRLGCKLMANLAPHPHPSGCEAAVSWVAGMLCL